ncbi:hypothetical protein BJ508DRAFT_307593 [Ascobolus immersus RN42]|uniref:Uncharacterized protein n=1 Tax=Ascobolus immersus RN42 TaxID=1160509 RepID=A0A3N4I7V9_ASCIM|nr:hypothetical protein BJ508DRAFT_307593 [Ascobolus immersus RN42]
MSTSSHNTNATQDTAVSSKSINLFESWEETYPAPPIIRLISAHASTIIAASHKAAITEERLRILRILYRLCVDKGIQIGGVREIPEEDDLLFPLLVEELKVMERGKTREEVKALYEEINFMQKYGVGRSDVHIRAMLG